MSISIPPPLMWSAPASVNRKLLGCLDGWCKQTKHVWCWLYITNFSSYLQPLPNLYPMAETLKTLDKLSPHVEGMFLQSSYSSRTGGLAAMQAWVYSRLLWNPRQDVRGLVKEFCEGFSLTSRAARASANGFLVVLLMFHLSATRRVQL